MHLSLNNADLHLINGEYDGVPDTVYLQIDHSPSFQLLPLKSAL
jgi:hypothetical protein